MAVPTYDELLARVGVESFEMEQAIGEKNLTEFSLKLDRWEMLAKSLELPKSEIERIKEQGDTEERRDKMLEHWKQRCGSKATYETLTRALLRINRTDLAEIVMTLCRSLREVYTSESVASTSQFISSTKSRLATPPSPASSGGVEDMSSRSITAPSHPMTATSVHVALDITPTLRELQEEFYQLVTHIEDILNEHKVELDMITRRFRMLPESIKRHHQRDEHYRDIRRRIMNSASIKDFFDNLTELKHWSYMMPDTLEYILKDVTIDAVHEKIGKYRDKLSTFKMNTKLGDLIGTRFPVPDYCIELTMEVKGWEDKTLVEAEEAVGNIMRCATYGQHVPLGWKGVEPGSLKLTFILLEAINTTSDIAKGVTTIKLDDNTLYTDDINALKVDL